MKLARLTHTSSTVNTATPWLITCTLAIAISVGALNNNTDLTTSVWDSLQTWLNSMLTSTWVLVLALIALIAAVWSLAHGGGYRGLS